MQSILPITTNDFKAKSNIVISKVEIDSDGEGTYIALPDVKDISIVTNIQNIVSRFCSYSFSISCLNTEDQFSPFKASSPYYQKLKRGRKLKIYMGIKKSGIDHYWQWQLWIIDEIKLSEKSGEKICTIIGRNLMGLLLDYKLYYPNTFWGDTTYFSVEAGQNRYQLPSIASGVYEASVDDIEPRNGEDEEDFSLLIEGTDFIYNKWENTITFGGSGGVG